MSDTFVSLDFGEMSSDAIYAMLIAVVQPRPIAFVSTLSLSGIPNLAPFSFFMAGGSNPPSLMYSPTLNRDGMPKDSLRNVLETGEFVVNTVHRAMAAGMNAASKEFPPDESEWGPSGFTPLPSTFVRPSRVAESLVQFECKLFQAVEHGHGPNSARYVIGEIVTAHLRSDVWDGKHVVSEKVRLLSRLGGPNYLDVNALEIFQLIRPSSDPNSDNA